ncbi:hypothetical protein HDU81_004312 [Chytriomyces hyalinus]|nr:hypothetical protein HDU81_004312 [Chytriomyces hyalinus]
MVYDSRLMIECFMGARRANSSELFEVLFEVLLRADSAAPSQDLLSQVLENLCAPIEMLYSLLPESKELVVAIKQVLSVQNCDPSLNNCKAFMDAASQGYTRVLALFLRDERVSNFQKKSMCCLYPLRHGVTIHNLKTMDERLDADLIIDTVKSMSKDELMGHLPALVTGSQVHSTETLYSSESVNRIGAGIIHETGSILEHEIVAYSAFSSAVRLKCMNLLNALIDILGSNITHLDDRGIRALIICIEDGYIEGLSRILPLLPNPPAKSICMQAIEADKMDILEILLNDQARRPEEYPVVHQAHLLQAAIDFRSYPAVKLLLAHYNGGQHGSHRILQ